MTGSDFFMYCLGLSTLLIACSGSIVLFRVTRKRHQVHEPRGHHTDDLPEGLERRLLEVQHGRYASSITRRELPPTMGPRQRILIKRGPAAQARPDSTEKG